MWRPCLLTDQDEMSNLNRGPSIDASYQVFVHLAKRFQRRICKNRPIRNKNCLFVNRSGRNQAWGELHWNVMHYITITLTKPCIKLQLQLHVFAKVMHYITITLPM